MEDVLKVDELKDSEEEVALANKFIDELGLQTEEGLEENIDQDDSIKEKALDDEKKIIKENKDKKNCND